MSNTDNAMRAINESRHSDFFANNLFIGRLSLERCRMYVAHLHALLLLCGPEAYDAGSLQEILGALDRELGQGSALFDRLENI